MSISNIDKIREEVEKIVSSINPFIPDEDGNNSDYEAGRFAMATQIMQIIDSLQEEPVSKDLEEAAIRYAALQAGMKDAMTSEYYEEYPYSPNDIEAFKAGAQWQKEQMMKNALISTVIEDLLYKSIVPTLQASIAEYKNGDKVKVIIVKED